MPVNSQDANKANCAGILLSITPTHDFCLDADNSQLLATLRQSAERADIRSEFRGPVGIRVLVCAGLKDAEQLKNEVLGGALRRFGVTRARVVALDEWEADIKAVQSMLQQDESGLTEVLTRFGGRIGHSFTRRFRGALGEDEIEAVLNAAAWKLWRSASKFDPELGSLGSWFYRIAEHEAFDCIRAGPHNDVQLDFEPDLANSAPWGTTSHRGNKTLIADLDEVVESLSRVQKTIILADLAAGERADDQQLANQLDTTVNVIRVSRNKARKRIFKELKNRGHNVDQ